MHRESQEHILNDIHPAFMMTWETIPASAKSSASDHTLCDTAPTNPGFKKSIFPIISSTGKIGPYCLPDPQTHPQRPTEPIKMTYSYWISQFGGETLWSEKIMTYYEWSSCSTYPERLKIIGWAEELRFPYNERFRWRGGILQPGPCSYFKRISRPVLE